MKKIELGNAFDYIRNGASIKQDENKGGYPITRIETIWNETIDTNRLGYADILENNLMAYDKYLLDDGDILMTHINSPKHLGKSAMYDGIPEKLIHGMNLLCLRPNREITFPKYIVYFFNSKYFRELLPSIANQSVNQASFNVGKLKKLQIPLPPLDVQQKIASILDAADTLRQKDKALLAKYDELTQALFLDMFGDPVSNPKVWEKVKLGDLCGVGSSKRVFVDELVDSGIPFYRGTEVGKLGEGKEIIPTLFITEEHYQKLKKERGIPKKGDLLMPSICPDGRIWVIDNDSKFYFKDGRVLWIEVDGNKMNSSYLKYHLKGSFFANYNNIASGTTFAELKIVALKKLNVLYPDIKLQNQYAERITIIEQQKAQAQASLEKSEELFNSLLQKAFNGELVEP